MPTDLQLMLQLLMQIIVLLGTCAIMGAIGKRFLSQGQVTMEMVTGVLLGPSLLGILAPDFQARLFPLKIHIAGQEIRHPSMSILYCLAQLGLVLYMFCVGMEFDISVMGSKAKAAVSVSLAGILTPLALTTVVFFVALSGRTDLFQPGISTTNQLIYLGAAMCITAFPMLARIIHEEGLAQTSLGVVALGAGAMDDGLAWIALAVVIALSQSKASIAAWAIGGSVVYGFVLFGPIRRWIARFADLELTQLRLVVVLTALFLCAWFTDTIGIYAVFGAFTFGAVLKRGRLVDELTKKIEPVTTALLLPCFFVYSGLNTHLSLLSSPEGWLLCLLLLAVAIGGKFGGCYTAAKLSGESQPNAGAIGALMNARGLMELIILDIGMKQGIITQKLYAMLAVMAVVTTLMAVPIYRAFRGRSVQVTS